MAARKPPEAWFWSHDIRGDQIKHVVTPGMHLMRLSSYGSGERRRFAALVYKEPGADRSYAIDLDAAALAAQLGETGARPVAITVDSAEAGPPRFSVVLQHGPGPLCSAHVDLDEAGVRALIDDQHGIADVATYVAGGVRQYAVIVEERTPGSSAPGFPREAQSWFFAGVTPHQLDARLLELDASLVRLRAYSEDGKQALVAVAERSRGAGWAWYTDLDGDAVARSLENNSAYPIDLDATRDQRGTRFTVVMVRDR
jgi:hypothetical protein